MSLKRKIMQVLLSLMCLVPFLGGFSTAFADEAPSTIPADVDITIHKMLYPKGTVIGPGGVIIDNDGAEVADDQLQGGVPFANVTFTIYDVTQEYLTLMKATPPPSAQVAIQEIQRQAGYGMYASKAPVQVGKTNYEGAYKFENLPTKDGDEYKVYVIVETAAPVNVEQKAMPIVLTMPLYDKSGTTPLTDIHVYPKNLDAEVIDKGIVNNPPLFQLEVGDREYLNVQHGSIIDYAVTTLVPLDLADKVSYFITDKPDVGLEYIDGTLEITGNSNLIKNIDYTVYKEGTGWKLTFFGDHGISEPSPALRMLEGSYLTITYQMKVTTNAPIDTGFNNRVTLNVDNQPLYEDRAEDLITGGKQFIKMDHHTGAAITDNIAEFQLVKINSATKNIVEYAKYEDGDYTWSTDSSKAGTFSTNSNGVIELKGLKYSEELPTGYSYALTEITAPDGYVMAEGPFEFVVEMGSYDPDAPMEIENVQQGFLPATGGMGIIAFLVVGAGLMGFSLYKLRKTDEPERV